MEDIGTNLNSTTIDLSLVSQVHETSIGFVDVLLLDKRFPLSKPMKIAKGVYILSNVRRLCVT